MYTMFVLLKPVIHSGSSVVCLYLPSSHDPRFSAKKKEYNRSSLIVIIFRGIQFPKVPSLRGRYFCLVWKEKQHRSLQRSSLEWESASIYLRV